MKNFSRWAALALSALLFAVPALAQNTTFTSFVNTAPTATNPLGSADYFAVTQSGVTKKINGTSLPIGIATPNYFPADAGLLGNAPVNIIMDGDTGQDVDDMGSFAVAFYFAAHGYANIIAATESDANVVDGPARAAVNNFYGASDIPVGQAKTNAITNADYYGTFLATNFPNRLSNGTTPDALKVWRTALAHAADNSVVILLQGTMANLFNVYNSPADAISPLTGSQLLIQKTSKIVILGGFYPGGGSEYDFTQNPTATQVINQLSPSLNVVYSGGENCNTVLTAPSVAAYHIEQAAYEHFFATFGGSNRPSWGACATLYAIIGLTDGTNTFFTLSAAGRNSVDAGGVNTWTSGGSGTQHYLVQALSDGAFVTYLQNLMNTYPARPSGILPRAASGFDLHGPLNLTNSSSQPINFFKLDNATGSAAFTGLFGIDYGATLITGGADGALSFRSQIGKYEWSTSAGGAVGMSLDTGTATLDLKGNSITATTALSVIGPVNLAASAGSALNMNCTGNNVQIFFKNAGTTKADAGLDCAGNTIINGSAANTLAIRNDAAAISFSASNSGNRSASISGGVLDAASGFSLNGSAGITETCTVIPTGITIKGGIITAITGGTCTP